MTFYERFEHLCNTAFPKARKPSPVAEEIGYKSPTVGKWKKGAMPDGNTLIKIANYFDVSIDYLVGRTEVKEVGGEQELKPNERELITYFRTMSTENKYRLLGRAETYAEQDEEPYQQEEA